MQPEATPFQIMLNALRAYIMTNSPTRNAVLEQFGPNSGYDPEAVERGLDQLISMGQVVTNSLGEYRLSP